ncbi:hypothetical protein RHMOL_Rhmol01G0098800 [Rhododendron molle]|uniref:Uncharacterized protein n=1 Tax=Rhododendron molle TaxID=49168 RepID=A0ACC0Q032_RHOML|nr:hypothetical protein RHMOL_Rhmol01G0098800 [Rhododendron molle]
MLQILSHRSFKQVRLQILSGKVLKLFWVRFRVRNEIRFPISSGRCVDLFQCLLELFLGNEYILRSPFIMLDWRYLAAAAADDLTSVFILISTPSMGGL